MTSEPSFDVGAAHKYFAADCFNKTWDLLEKKDRTPEEDEQMLRLTFASTWHWTQRPDCTQENMSIGYWQMSRVYVVLGQADNARRYGQLALQAGQADGAPQFCVAYGYEALARAEMVAGKRQAMQDALAKARQTAEAMTDLEAKKMVLDDLATIK